MSFPTEHRRLIVNKNSLERLNKEIERHADVVGIFSDGIFSCSTDRSLGDGAA